MKITAKTNDGQQADINSRIIVPFADEPFGADYQLANVVIYQSSEEITLLYQRKTCYNCRGQKQDNDQDVWEDCDACKGTGVA